MRCHHSRRGEDYVGLRLGTALKEPDALLQAGELPHPITSHCGALIEGRDGER